MVLVSNRGPLSFRYDGGEPVAHRGGGGLVSGIAPLVAGTDTRWIAAALSDADRAAARNGLMQAESMSVRLLDLDPDQFRLAYDVVCNATLWFVHHGLFDASRRPVFNHRWQQAWEAYTRVNKAFADAVAEEAPEDAAVLIQDYHLYLLASRLADTRPDLACVHFSHTPFAGPDLLRMLPTETSRQILESMAAHRACGFHSQRWANRFTRCCESWLGYAPESFVSPLAPDYHDMTAALERPETMAAREHLEELVGDRAFLVRVDRIELSKNILRGFMAFEALLEDHPEWVEKVVFGAFVYPSREGLAEYMAYRQEVEHTVERINRRWGTEDWTPVLLGTDDDFPRSVAALSLSDALLVNPISDGLNLVALEGTMVNDRDSVLVLSSEAGVADQIGDAAVIVNPFDIGETSEGLHRALKMGGAERADRAERLRSIATSRSPSDWLAAQRSAAGEP